MAPGANGHAGLMLPPPPRPPKRTDPDPDPGLAAAPAGASGDGGARRPSGDAGSGLRAGDAQAIGDAAAESGGEAGEGPANPGSGDDAHAAVTAVHAKSAALFREWLAGHKAAQAAAEKARPCHSETEVQGLRRCEASFCWMQDGRCNERAGALCVTGQQPLNPNPNLWRAACRRGWRRRRRT